MLNQGFLIKNLKARQIFDSRGTPTVEVKLQTKNGWVIDSAPSGASTGEKEARELRDGKQEYWGKGVYQAVNNINEIITPALLKKDVRHQREIDHLLIDLDGTKNKSRLGANAILPVSLAVSRAAAQALHLPLWRYLNNLYQSFSSHRQSEMPQPSFNILNGGMHAGNQLSIQEFMVVPLKESFAENLKEGVEIYHALKEILIKTKGGSEANVGDEGGMAPSLTKTEEALDLLVAAIARTGFSGVKLGIDCAASEFYQGKNYFLDGQSLTQDQLLSFYKKLTEKYTFLFLEDPFDEEDWTGFQKITENLGSELIIIGDDLLTTNVRQIKEAAEKKAVNGVIIKPNQIGSLTETLQAIASVQKNQWKVMVSHRSGETNDDFIADLAVGVGADFIKTGAPARGERVAKYNRLLAIEEEINE